MYNVLMFGKWMECTMQNVMRDRDKMEKKMLKHKQNIKSDEYLFNLCTTTAYIIPIYAMRVCIV